MKVLKTLAEVQEMTKDYPPQKLVDRSFMPPEPEPGIWDPEDFEALNPLLWLPVLALVATAFSFIAPGYSFAP